MASSSAPEQMTKSASAEMTDVGEEVESKKMSGEPKKDAPAEQDAENAQVVKTCDQEPESKELVETSVEHDGKTKVVRKVPNNITAM